jgi:hypothetical protein
MTTSSVTVSPTTTTVYTVFVSNLSTCTQQVNITIIVNPAPPTPSVLYQGGQLICLSPGYMYQWFLNGTPIPGATQQTYTPTVNGQYWVVITDSIGGCGAMSSPGTVYDIQAIEEQDLIFNSTLYPNPSNGLFTLSYYSDEMTEIKITNTLGELIYSEKVNRSSNQIKKKIDISRQTKGIYFLQINSSTASATHKINLN